MRDLRELEHCRIRSPEIDAWFTGADASIAGLFSLRCGETGGVLAIIATSGEGWDHVSVSLERRIPTWTEMEFVKRRFFRDDETAMQLHVPPADHINHHPYCLHLWRPLAGFGEIPRPPARMVGPKTMRGAA